MIGFLFSSSTILYRLLCLGHALTIIHLFIVQLERGLHGLEPVVVAKFPTRKYSDEYFSASENTQYVISLAVEFLNELAFMCFFQILLYIGECSSLLMFVMYLAFSSSDIFAIFPTLKACIMQSVGKIYSIVPVLFFHHFRLHLALWWAMWSLNELLLG